jgi:hypothetical protein
VGKMGDRYGSEFHLLRYLGYHRHDLNRAVEKETGGRVSDWLDFAFGGEGRLDRERKGVDFVDSASDVKSAWLEFWPQSGNVPNWDAVGRLESNSGIEYLLVTIKANGFTADVEEWLRPYYQYANRLAHLHFLIEHRVRARLVFIYFCGDNWNGRTLSSRKPPNCPKDAQQWESYLKDMYDRLRMKGQSKLEERVHSLFLHI